MSVNAFYDAYSGVQNALGDPRGDARKREQEDMKNAMLQREMDMKQRQMQMREFEFGQKEQEAQRAEAERQLLAARARRDWEARNYGGNRQPDMGANPTPPPMPMANPQMAAQGQGAAMTPMAVGGAPIAPQAPVIDPVSGREVEQVTVTGTPRMQKMDEGSYKQRLLKAAIEAGDIPEANRIHSEIQMGMSEQERMGRLQLASEASRIIELPTHEQRARAALAAMEQYNIDPAETQIDDYVNDPQMLVFALSNILDGGSLEDAIKGNLAVNKFRREQMAEQEFAPVSPLNLGNQQLLYGGTGNEVGRFNVGIPQETIYKERQANARNTADNITSDRNSKRSASGGGAPTGAVPTVVSIREVAP
jgi:hypothetical protein